MAGSRTAGDFPVYGDLGKPDAANTPGVRSQPVTWTDQKGNLWLFGGEGISAAGNNDGYLNDLWEFNPSTRTWTWVNGSNVLDASGVQPGAWGTLGLPAVGNVPSGRSGGVGWTDPDGNMWLFGGVSFVNGRDLMYFNDLWKYNPSTNQWAWMGGANVAGQSGSYGTLGTAATGNVPGARNNAVGVADAKGSFWLFGGAGIDSRGGSGNLSDLWKFTPSTGQWTWVSGANVSNQAAVPGTLRQPAAGNVPASRNAAVGWMDATGNLWIFGGVGIGTPTAAIGSVLNDLWRFDPGTNQWTWMSGSASVTYPVSNAGVYGTLQTPADANVPGSRTGAVSWTDRKGNLWLFGGVGHDSTNGAEVWLNDLWEFNTALGQWAWMGGDSRVPPQDCSAIANWCGAYGVYGTLQTPALGNAPGGRDYGAVWSDNKGNFWLFGGVGYDVQGNTGYLSDMWEFEPNTASSSTTAAPVISPASGTYAAWQTVTISDATPGATISYSINGSTPALTYTAPVTVSSSETIEAIASASGYANSNIASANYVENLPQATTPVFSLGAGTYSTPQTVSIYAGNPGATIYYAIGAVPTTASAVYRGPITVSSSEKIEAIAVANGYLNSAVATAVYSIGANPPAQWTWMGGSSTVPAKCPLALSCGQAGWYGTFQTPAPANVPPARFGAATWTDTNGNLWLFGGQGNLSALNDLWEYKPSFGEWAWMAGSGNASMSHSGVYGTLGSPGPANTPGSRANAATWVDHQGNLWLFGGLNLDGNFTNGYLNDLWKFSPALNQWTWMGGAGGPACTLRIGCYYGRGVYGTLGTPGAGNIPGARSSATAWVDSDGNFWLYGGQGADGSFHQCYLNDQWKFNPGTQQWTWMGGNKFCVQSGAGVYGNYDSVGIPAVGTNPGSLTATAHWTDSSGNLWLSGGSVESPTQVGYILNDTWEFNREINQWAMTSPNSFDAPGGSNLPNYGVLGIWYSGNIPGARSNAASWTDSQGNGWMFGGGGLTSSRGEATLNELWEFKPALNEWAWMGGSKTSVCLVMSAGICTSYGQPGTYGTLGTPASANIPGARIGANTWTDRNGNLWLFGGTGFDAAGSNGYLNDLWQYDAQGTPTAAPTFPSAAMPAFTLATGTYSSAQTLSISDQTPGATIYYTTDGTFPTSSSPVYTAPLPISSSETVEAIAIASNYAASPLATASYTFNLPQAASPTFSIPAGTYSAAQTVTLSDATPGAVIYYTTNGSAPTAASTIYSSAITISATETIKAIAVAAGYTNSPAVSAAYTITPPPTFTLQTTVNSVTVRSGSPGMVTLGVTPQYGFNSTVSFGCSGLPAGVICSFSPASITVSGGPATSILTITKLQSAAIRPAGSASKAGLVTVALTLLIVSWKHRRLGHVVSLAMLFLGLILISGCGSNTTGANSGGNGGAASIPVTSTVTITATAGAVQQTTLLSLTVE